MAAAKASVFVLSENGTTEWDRRCIQARSWSLEPEDKVRKFYRVGVAGRESKRPRILAAIPEVGVRGCASTVREAVWK